METTDHNGEDAQAEGAWVQGLRQRLIDALEWDLPRPMVTAYGPHEQAFRDGYADCYRLHRAMLEALPVARARVDALAEALAVIADLPEGATISEARLIAQRVLGFNLPLSGG